jgi:asparagine synthase (glutamine-hydrolysing)
VSVQFGRWNFDRSPIAPSYIQKVHALLVPYGPDGRQEYSSHGIQIVYFPFHTTGESRDEIQPYVTVSGAVLTWDGRLDNRRDLARELRGPVSEDAADSSVAAAAYEHWGTDAFAKLLGDWAISIWDPRKRSLLLAKDFVGSRHLYYSADHRQVTWCSILDPLVLGSASPLELEEEYLAGWLSSFPAAHLTPFVGIHSIRPASFILLQPGALTVQKYWEFDPGKQIKLRNDAQYEEHFRTVFAQSVRRRLRSDAPVVAELSGGMDSSSIVCVADDLVATEGGGTPRLDTVSYYDDSESNWNERPYFAKVEERRGRVGGHIDVAWHSSLQLEYNDDRFSPAPGATRHRTGPVQEFSAFLRSQGNRVLLSGIGGDEVLGGVPTSIPELADLFATANIRELARQLVAWSLATRKPVLYLVAMTALPFLPLGFAPVSRHKLSAPWFPLGFVRRHQSAYDGYPARLKLFGPRPSFQENLSALDLLRRQLGRSIPSLHPLCEKRYPYLDRDLLEFLYAIPREQLIRPGQRRSLMRRALAGIVPDEILKRRRKAYVARGLLTAVARELPAFLETMRHMIAASLGIVDQKGFIEALRRASNGEQIPLVPILRTIELEYWLRHLRDWHVLPNGYSPSREIPRQEFSKDSAISESVHEQALGDNEVTP